MFSNSLACGFDAYTHWLLQAGVQLFCAYPPVFHSALMSSPVTVYSIAIRCKREGKSRLIINILAPVLPSLGQ